MTGRLVPVAIGGAAMAVIGWESWHLAEVMASNGHLADAGSYQAAVMRWLNGGSPYSAAQLSGPHTLGSAVGGSGFVYPPAALPLFLPLAIGLEATLAWVLLTHLAFIAVVYVIAHRELRSWRITSALVAVACALALPGMDEMRFGNASALIAFLLGLMWLAPRHAPLFAVLAGAIKVFPIAGGAWSVRWGGAFAPAVLAAAALLAVSLITGLELWGQWVTAMTSAVPSCPEWALTSLPCATGSSLPGLALSALLLVGAMAAPSRRIGFLLLSVAMITPAPDLYHHYTLVPFVGALPVACHAAAGILRTARGSERAPAAIPA